MKISIHLKWLSRKKQAIPRHCSLFFWLPNELKSLETPVCLDIAIPYFFSTAVLCCNEDYEKSILENSLRYEAAINMHVICDRVREMCKRGPNRFGLLKHMLSARPPTNRFYILHKTKLIPTRRQFIVDDGSWVCYSYIQNRALEITSSLHSYGKKWLPHPGVFITEKGRSGPIRLLREWVLPPDMMSAPREGPVLTGRCQ